MPYLRLCIEKKEKEVRFRERRDPYLLDFLELKTGSWRDNHATVLRSNFDTEEGPLWRCRLQNLEDDGVHLNGVMGGEDHNDSKLANRSVLMFGIHHCISDGTSTCKMLGILAKLINNIQEGIDPQAELNYDIMQPMDVLCKEDLKWKIREDIPYTLYQAQNVLLSRATFSRYYPPDKTVPPATKMIPIQFTKAETKELVLKCKKEQVTVNSALTFIAAYANYSMIYEKCSKSHQKYIVPHCVNCRRYVNAKHCDFFGNYVLVLEDNMHCNYDMTVGGIWETAKDMSASFHERLDGKMPLKYIRCTRLLVKCVYFDNIRRYVREQRWRGSARQDISFTNLGRVDHSIEANQSSVEVSGIFKSLNSHDWHSVFVHNPVTVGGRLNWNLAYCTNYTNEEAAMQYAQRIKDVFNILVRAPDDTILLPEPPKRSVLKKVEKKISGAYQFMPLICFLFVICCLLVIVGCHSL